MTQLERTASTRLLARTAILWIVLASLVLMAAMGASAGPLTTLHSIRALNQADARAGLPVAFEATVTYYNKGDVDLFVQEGSEAIYVEAKQNEKIAVGDRVLVRGRTRESFALDILSDSVTVLHHSLVPQPKTANFRELISGQSDCMLVTVHALVRSADAMEVGNANQIYLRLLMDGGYVDATVVGIEQSQVQNLLDAEVEVTGVVSGKFDSKMQLIGILLEVPSLANVKILKPTQSNLDSLPVTPMDRVLSSSYLIDKTNRVRVQGSVTYYQPGSAIVLQNGNKSIWVSTRTTDPIQIGDLAEASGFPNARSNFLALEDGEVRDRHIYMPIQPQPSVFRKLADWNSGDGEGHQNDLVSIEGQVVAAVREHSRDELDLISDGKLFTAIYRHPPGIRPLAEMKYLPAGTRVRITGICMIAQGNAIDPGHREVPFDILVRSFDDVTVIAKPTWLSVGNLVRAISILALMMLAVLVWGWTLRRKVFRQTAVLGRQAANEAARERHTAELQRRRGQILEDINGTRPLAEILEEIAALVSFQLKGPPCWCEIVDGARLGIYPANAKYLHVASEEIRARSGPALGTMFVAFLVPIQKDSPEQSFVRLAAQLATLAIETRRMYTDLIRRSEFDLLTNIHNRFSLETRLDILIANARECATTFGIVYVDLDEFKQVNDLYGHRFGDLYLQAVANRLSHQMRASDLLARLGGDEFAALLPSARTRAEVEEIAVRLAACFEEAFAIEGYVLRGSASFGIALYPVDGATKDSLLSVADAEMYVDKHTRKDSAFSRVQNGPGHSSDDQT